MNSIRRVIGLLAVLCFTCGEPAHADQPVMVQQLVGTTNFTIPDGYRIDLVADEKLTTWPMLADWAASGDLLVVESGGVGTPIEEHNKQLLHRVVRLTDTNGDGRFDQRTVVADQLPFTEGVLCVGDDVLITSPPVIYRLSQPDANGVFQKRDVWFDGQTLTWCANDLHGPFLGRDGWIYWCKGAFGQQTHELVNGQALSSTAAHIFRRRLEGGPIEPVMTGGMDNPNGLAILPNGERFFTSTFLHHPGGGKRDGIVHSVYGGLHGKSHDVLKGHWSTGPLLPVTVELGAAAPAGLTHWESGSALFPFPGDVLAAALYNLQKVTAHQMRPSGATYTATSLDLVVADRIDFHPTDVVPDADGSLLIIDTGGWYDLCCPTSRVDQKAANGGIYRLSRSDAPRLSQARSNRQFNPEQDWSDRLVDPRRWIARRALLDLAFLDADAKEKLGQELATRLADSNAPTHHRQSWLWALSALDTNPANEILVTTLKSPESELAHVACHAISVNRINAAVENLEWLVTSDRPLEVRRAAVEALGRVGRPGSANVLFTAVNNGFSDLHWQHSVTYALLELDSVAASRALLLKRKASIWQFMTAFQILDQLGQIEDTPLYLLVLLVTSDDDLIREKAVSLMRRHPEWSETFSPLLHDWYGDLMSDPQRLVEVIAGWRDQHAVQSLIGEWLGQAVQVSSAQSQRLNLVLSVYQHQPLRAEWERSFADWLKHADGELRTELLRLLRECKFSNDGSLVETLRNLALAEADLARRLDLIAALPEGHDWDSTAIADSIIDALDAEELDLQVRATNALTRVKVSPKHSSKLLERLDRQTINTIVPVVAAISRSNQDELDRKLLQALTTLPTAKSISTDQLLNLYQHRSAELKAMAEETIQIIHRPSADVARQVEEMLARLPKGNALDGLQVFRSTKALCSACHRLGYVGGELGPELSTIGSSRTRAALLEAILFPNARLEQGYRTTKFLTTNGQTYTGVVVRQLDAESFLLQTGADQTVVIRNDEIELQEPGTVSIMPSGIGEVLSPQELADLLAILEAAR
ncbi:MAG: HEAT repeat domain-containing protein [Pirellulaceae bacterium]|nr:HEAT repeat domain-containing protein [Pirellulaceae bacterium]